MARAALAVGTGQGLTAMSSFVRNVLVARLVGAADFGITLTLSMSVQVLEMVSNFAADRLLVQAEDGQEKRLQYTAQLFEVIRGGASAALLFVLAGPIARLFNEPGTAWAFRWLALVPLLRGFMHMDMKRFQGEMRFAPSSRVQAVSSLVATLAAWPLAFLFGDYRVMLVVLLLQAVLMMLGSHLVAERPYRLAWDPSYRRRILDFGWPLLLNGALLFLIFQGDRMVIASADRIFGRPTFTKVDLGVYGVAFALTHMISILIVQVTNAVLLPPFARSLRERDQLGRIYDSSCQVLSWLAALYGMLFIVAGGPLVTLIYGPEYSGAGAFIGWLGAMQAVRIVRPLPTQIAIAHGDTRSPLLANAVRSAAFVAILVVAGLGGDLSLLAACGSGGELLAYVYSLHRMRCVQGIAARPALAPGALAGVGLAAAGVVRMLRPEAGLLELVVELACVSLGLSALFFALFRRFREICLDPLGSYTRG